MWLYKWVENESFKNIKRHQLYLHKVDTAFYQNNLVVTTLQAKWSGLKIEDNLPKTNYSLRENTHMPRNHLY